MTIYGAPQIPACGPNETFAFQYPVGQDAWTRTVPTNTDILVTHTPANHYGDLPNPAAVDGKDADTDAEMKARGEGDPYLAREVARVRPLLHVCGHIHEGRGVETVWWDEGGRAYERICERGEGRGLFWGIVDWLGWVDVLIMIYWALWIAGRRFVRWLWKEVWGGEEVLLTGLEGKRQENGRREAGWCVNAAMAIRNTGRCRTGDEAFVF